MALDGSHPRHPRYAAATAAAVLALAAPAAAQEAIPPNNGGATQYIGPAPDPGGDRPADPAGPAQPAGLP
ncbi:MAG TPA: hypothetical protein VF545_01335, partial [Thermoleophilaceae bacterium]